MFARELQDRYLTVKAEIERETLRCARIPGSVRLLAVSKFHPREALADLLEIGHEDFGENYVQEAKAKFRSFENLGGRMPKFHCIGHLQRNKVKDGGAS